MTRNLRPFGWLLAAQALPTLLIFNVGPLPSFYSQVAAVALWGGLVYAETPEWIRFGGMPANGASALTVATILVIVLALESCVRTHLPAGIAICFCGAMCAQQTVTYFAIQIGRRQASRVFFLSLLLCAVLNACAALIEVFAPEWADGRWLASPWSSDRISGNLRQPNLLATMSVLGVISAAALAELSVASLTVMHLIVGVLTLTLACTGSRVGIFELAAVATASLWVDRLTPAVKRLLIAAPAATVLFWALLQLWSHVDGSLHGRVADASSGRFVMWGHCLRLISDHPWLGVGFGNFNFAWTLTPFDRTNPETFDHAHNLVLHWAVEFGIPAAFLLVGLICAAFFCGIRVWRRTESIEATEKLFCLLAVAVVLIHSLTEYPLWYTYFLLPMMFAWGLAMSPARRSQIDKPVHHATAVTNVPASRLRAYGLSMALGAALVVYDYQHIIPIYSPYDNTPIEQRVAEGRKSILFAYLADRFAGTLAINGTRTLEPYKTATRQLLDMRLLIAWSLAMRESGQLDKARYLAQRVKDFQTPVAQQFFDKCRQPSAPNELPWQCTPPTGHYTYEDFL